MADPRYGAGGEGFPETLARMQQAASASDALRQKEEQRASVEERSTGALRENLGARAATADATDRLASSLTGVIDLLNAETRALQANSAAWRQRLAASEGASGVAYAPRQARRAVAPAETFIGPVESPQIAQARRDDTLRAQAAAEIQATAARRAVSSAQRTAGTTPEELAPLIAQREAANAVLKDARAQSAAAEANVRANQEAAAARDASTRAYEAENARLAAAQGEHAAAEQAAAAAAREAAAEARRAASAQQRAVIAGGGQLGVGSSPLLLGRGSAIAYGRAAVPLSDARNFIAGPAGGSGRVVQRGEETFTSSEQRINSNALATERLAGAQGNVNRVVQQSIAQYGAASQALQRHGALTSEFIQAFARGEVTLQEFQSQMLTTMGKFGGWALAAAAVYGVVDAFKKLSEGAKVAQTGYVQLTRFIPNVSQTAATNTFTDISSELNVPIKDVVDTMTIMARTFKTLPEAATATRAALLATRLDQISPQQSAPYLVGISQAFGLDAKGTLGVVDSLNALQRQYGARVSETLPGLAKAAPAALAAGVDQHTLEALIGVGVRGGLTGSQVATAVARSATTFVQKPANQALLESYGFNPNQSYGTLIKDISSFIGRRNAQGQAVSGKELRDLAVGLAGPQLGARTFATILARGGNINTFAATAASPGETATQERQKQLHSVSEEIHSIGIGLENFGAALSTGGILVPLQGILAVLHQIETTATTVVSPLAAIGNALSGLPAPLRELIGVLALAGGGRAAYRSTFGRTATGAVGRIPGFSFLDTPERQAVRQLEQTQRAGLDYTRNQLEQSAGRAAGAAQGQLRAVAARTSFEAERPVAPLYPGDNASAKEAGEYDRLRANYARDSAAFEEQLARLQAAEVEAARKATAAQEAYLTDLDTVREFEARIKFYKSRELSDSQKVADAARRGDFATPSGSPTTNPVLGPKRASASALERNVALTPEARARQQIDEARGTATATPPAVTAGLPLARTGGSAAALTGVAPEVVATQALRAAEAEQPGFIAGKFRTLEGKLGAGGGLTRALGATAAGSAADFFTDPRRLPGPGHLGTIGAGLVGGVPNALGSVFQGLIAGQVAQAVLPGAAGNFAGNLITGGSLALGGSALINSVLRQYGITNQIGGASAFAIGAGVSEVQSKNPVSDFLGAGLLGGGIGSLLDATGPGLLLGLGLEGLSKVPALINPVDQGASANAQRQGAPAFHPPNFLGIRGASDVGDVLFGGLFGDSTEDKYRQQKAQYDKQYAQWRASQAQIRSISGLTAGQGDIQGFGDTFDQQLTDAFDKTGDDAKKAVTGMNHTITVLASKLQVFGGQSSAGQGARALLNEAVGRTVARAGADPGNLDQYVQIAQKAQQALQSDAQQTFQIANARATSGAGRAAAFQQLIAAEEESIRSSYTDRIGPLQDTLSRLEARYNDQLAKRGTSAFGGSRSLNVIGNTINQTQGAISALQQGAAQQRALNQVTDAQGQTQVYSGIQSDIQSAGALSQAKAGADSLKNLRVQLASQHAELANAAANLTLNPDQQTNETEQINAKIAQTSQAIVQEQIARIQSLEKLREAQTPLNVPLAAVSRVFQDAQGDLARMRAANADAARHGQGPLYSPEQIQQQQIQIISDRRSVVAQGLTNLQANESLTQSQVPSFDPVAQAQGTLSSAQQSASYIQSHAKDFNFADVTNALSAVNNARQAVADAVQQQQVQMAQVQTQIAQARDFGNVIAQAQDAIDGARQQLNLARTPLERATAYGALIAAQNDYNQALIQHTKDETAYSASLTNDPVRQAAIALSGAAKELSQARGPENKLQAQTNLNNLRQQYEQAVISQREGTIDFQLQMQQITTDQAIQQLEALLKLKGSTLQDRQSIQEKIRQLQSSGSQSGQFDLAPVGASVRLPTQYDVLHAARGPIERRHVEAIAHSSVGTVDARTYINVHVARASDVPAVADAIESASGARIKAKLRAAGMRGT